MAEAMKPEGLDALKDHVARSERKSKIERLRGMSGYTVKSALEILKANPKPPTEIWGGICLENEVYEIIGASGIGKSRIMLNLAVRQCLADTKPDFDEDGQPIPCEFAGRPLYKGPVKWLLLGTENGLYRYHNDLSGMTRSCTQEQLRVLGERLFVTTLEGDGDSYMTVDGLSDDKGNNNFDKLRATIAKVMPDVIVLDPWGDFIGGSELEDKVVRETVATLRSLRYDIMDRMAIIIVNHSRMGLAENVKAFGLDGANFGKNSKALYTVSRAVWNLAFLEDDITSNVIAFLNNKRSNGRKYDPTAVRFDENTMSYETIENIDVAQRLRELSCKASQPAHNNTEVRSASFNTKIDDVANDILKILNTRVMSKSSIHLFAKGKGMAERNINDLFEKLKEIPGIEVLSNTSENNKIYYGTTEQIAALQERNKKKQAEKQATEEKKKEAKEAEKAAKRAAKAEAKAARKPAKRGRKPKK